MNGFALNNISNCYIGNQQVSSIYMGNTKIWPSTPTHDYSRDYFTIEALSPICNLSFKHNTTALNSGDCIYLRKNNDPWYLLRGTSSSTLVTINEGDKLSVYVDIDIYDVRPSLLQQYNYTAAPLTIMTATSQQVYPDIKVYGNVGSLWWGQNFLSHGTTRAAYELWSSEYHYYAVAWYTRFRIGNPDLYNNDLIGPNIVDYSNVVQGTNYEYVR